MNETARGGAPRDEFVALFLGAERDIYRYVCALVPDPQKAEDVVQETALALWRSFERYDCARPFLPWALGFALNVVRKHAEREGERPLLLGDEELFEMIVAEQQSRKTQFDDQRHRLHECLDKLPPRQLNLIRGYYWDRIGVAALAQQYRSSVEAIYKRLQRIRALLLDCLQQLERRENQANARLSI
jgi:RNA polymerase sigma-70 factor (ECF subfamily)